MPERFTIDDYFAEARNREEQPLLDPEAVPGILPKKQEKPRTISVPSTKKTRPWLAPVLGLGLSAAAIATFMLLPDTQQDDTALFQQKEVPVQEQQSFSSTNSTMPDTSPALTNAPVASLKSYAVRAPAALAEGSIQQDMAREAVSDYSPLSIAAAPTENIVGPALVSLSVEQLVPFGITVRDGKATYTGKTALNLPKIADRLRIPETQLLTLIREKAINLDSYTTPVRVVIRTDGIGTPPRDDSEKTPVPVATAPRIVSVYASGKLMATTWQRQDDAIIEQLRNAYSNLQDVRTDSSLNSLVPVHFRIEDKRNAYFREADVILWYDASSDFLQALPEPYRSRLLGEISSDTTTTYKTGEHYLDTWRTSSGAVISSALYPNPVTGNQTTLRFHLSESRTVTIAVHDIFGRRITELQQNTFSGEQTVTVPLPALLENGMYLVVLTTDHNEQIVQRLLLQR